jgi:hypothetical protein
MIACACDDISGLSRVDEAVSYELYVLLSTLESKINIVELGALDTHDYIVTQHEVSIDAERYLWGMS